MDILRIHVLSGGRNIFYGLIEVWNFWLQYLKQYVLKRNWFGPGPGKDLLSESLILLCSTPGRVDPEQNPGLVQATSLFIWYTSLASLLKALSSRVRQSLAKAFRNDSSGDNTPSQPYFPFKFMYFKRNYQWVLHTGSCLNGPTREVWQKGQCLSQPYLSAHLTRAENANEWHTGQDPQREGLPWFGQTQFSTLNGDFSLDCHGTVLNLYKSSNLHSEFWHYPDFQPADYLAYICYF